MSKLLLVALVLLPLAGCATPGASALGWIDDEDVTDTEEALEETVEEDDGHGVGHALLLYLPNRIFDVFDIVRARVRIGPGFGVQVRATQVASVVLAAYSTVFVGLHGHRGEPSIPWPVGLEILAGAEVSVVGADADAGMGPNYGPVEIGLGLHAALVGFDVGVEPLEILDLVTGFLFIDLVGDDY